MPTAMRPAPQPKPSESTCPRGTARWLIVFAALACWPIACAPPPDPDSPQVQDDETQSNAQYQLALGIFERGKPREALDHALRALELNEENQDAAYLIALIYLSFCQAAPADCHLEEAARHARRALQIRSDFREAQNLLGVVYIHQKKYDDAVTVLRPLSEDILYRTPENAWGNLGWAYLELGKHDDAIRALERAVAAEPNFCVGHYRLGLAYVAKRAHKILG